MPLDIRDTTLYREAENRYRALRQPGTGQISEAADIHVSPNGRHAIFSGSLVDALESTPPTRVCQVDLMRGDLRVLTFGPNVDRLPKFSPDGRRIAFLSDRHRATDPQLYLLDPESGAVQPTPPVKGWVEYLHWSPNGRRILLGVAGHGADIAGGQGAVTSKRLEDKRPSWMPAVETGTESYRWRSVWIYELDTHQVRQVSAAGTNPWEAAWCGNDAIVAVVSPAPGEGFWYSASLHIVQMETGRSRKLYAPRDQMGWPAASPSGKHLAIVEAICSDRLYVAGDLLLLEPSSGKVRRIDTAGIDITYTEWRCDRQLLVAGHRGFETVVGLYDVVQETFCTVWASREISTVGTYVSVCGFGDNGDCVLIGEGFLKAPEIAVIRQGEYHSVKSFDLGYADQTKVIETAQCMSWCARDGVEIQGYLLRPKGSAPHPLVMNVHGGPVWHWHPTCLGRGRVSLLMLLDRGYAIFFPNPRGSSGRGQEFARKVLGDMGGADTHDLLSGLDHLVEQRIADPKRLGVTGVSYGGFMTSWLITQDARFSAAVSVAPMTNHVTAHLISNIPHFMPLFMKDQYTNFGGKYFERSPMMYAHKTRTPTLNICGALDRCTPPAEAVQFHNALLEHGVRSELVTYPEEGHGVRRFPAAIDYAARVVGWFDECIGSEAVSTSTESGQCAPRRN